MYIGSEGAWKDLSPETQQQELNRLKDQREDAVRAKRDHAELDRKIREREQHNRLH